MILLLRYSLANYCYLQRINCINRYDLCWFTAIFPSATSQQLHIFYFIKFNIWTVNWLIAFVKAVNWNVNQFVCAFHFQMIQITWSCKIVLHSIKKHIASYLFFEKEYIDFRYNIVINDGYSDKAINIIHISCCEMCVQP